MIQELRAKLDFNANDYKINITR